jgi:restriction endonuclease S subunit
MPPFTLKIDASFSTETKSKSSIMASIEAFKSAVVRIRDILRGPGVAITGMDSMRHICLYLLSRYMIKDKVKSLGVPDEFAWENLIETAQTKNGGVQKALDCFFHKETDCLVNHFDRLFGTENFSFDIKNPAKHKEMLEILDKVNMEQIDCQMDTLGWVYEQHLKTGSSAARDLGQFFTDRFICDYMVNLCKPGFKSKGVPESVCDPSMGTGGFLTSYMKLYKKHYADKPVDWSVQNKEIHGCDTDPKVAGVARLNLFMESGGNRAVNLRTHDSLYGDLTQTGYDLILANMPFGLKGIKHAECCERVNKLKIRGTKSEPLFLQLMMVSLNRGGRCAVVVPDGMLVNGSTCHDETRKYLLDHFELKRVIKMKGQFFMNTGIQPSILFFENTGKPTSAVEFWDVIKGANGDIEETMVLSVPRAKFDASCSFDMRRYQEVKAVANPAGFPMVKLDEVVSLKSGKLNTNRGVNYNIPYYCSNGVIGYVETPTFDGEYTITALDLSIGAVHYMNGKFATSQHAINLTSLDIKKLNNKYMYYWLKLNNTLLKNMSKGIKPGILRSDIANLQMPLPPIETQKEIVATLDRIYAPGTTELAETFKLTDKAMDLVLAGATAQGGASLEPIVEAQRLMRKSAQMVADVKAQMVADVKAQMVALMRSVNMRGFETIRLGDIIDMSKGKLQATKCDGGQYPVISISNKWTHSTNSDEGEHVYIASTSSGASSGPFETVIKYHNGKCSSTSLMQRLDIKNTNKISYKYLYYGLNHIKEMIQNMCEKGSCNKTMNVERFLDLQIIVPPVDVQQDIIRRIEVIQSQLSSLENLGKQAEDNARFILNSYLNTA